MKIIAFYLPQFHSIPENDLWWGKGFTEWENVKKSRPMFKGHNQPEKPFNDYYYNLLDSNVQVWQAELAKKYGIYGFCYYHYWFEGKKLLEKPMENMLRNEREIDLELQNRILNYYFNSKEKNIDLLTKYAKIFNIYEKVDTIVKVMMKW